jgi:hypothetical protein|tara:strand:+ start:7724 stop:8398 length:675 start_codon:yes stop_codon:yes gene_type:complete
MANSILDDLMYNKKKPTFSTKITPEMIFGDKKLSNRQLETLSAIQTANQVFEGKLPDVSNFMTNLAMQESNLGEGTSTKSYSPFQIDPIGYEDIAKKAAAGEKGTLKRASIANELLRNMGYGDDIDVTGFDYDKSSVDNQLRDPMIGALVTRLKLATMPKSIPTNLTEQAVLWKNKWNTQKGKGKPEEFIGEVQYYNNLLNIKTHDGTPLQEMQIDKEGNYYVR